MTVYSGVIDTNSKSTSNSSAATHDLAFGRVSIFKLNLAVAILVIALAAIYIFLANFLVYQKYMSNTLKNRFNQMSAKLSAESVDADTAGDLNALLLFAQKSDMVEAKDASIIWEDTGVASLPGAKF